MLETLALDNAKAYETSETKGISKRHDLFGYEIRWNFRCQPRSNPPGG